MRNRRQCFCDAAKALLSDELYAAVWQKARLMYPTEFTSYPIPKRLQSIDIHGPEDNTDDTLIQ